MFKAVWHNVTKTGGEEKQYGLNSALAASMAASAHQSEEEKGKHPENMNKLKEPS